MILNSSNLTNLFVAYSSAFDMGFRMMSPQWGQVATRVPSTTSANEYGWLGQFPKLREWAGDRVVHKLEGHSYSITNKKFESTIEIDRDKIEDDQYGLYTPLFEEMGYAAATHPDELVWELVAKGTSERCYDDQFFFDTDHPVAGQPVSNYINPGTVAPWYMLDTRRPLKPFILQDRRSYDFRAMTNLDSDRVFDTDKFKFGVDGRSNVGYAFWQQAFASTATLDATGFNTVYAAMTSFKSDEGRPLGVMPNLLVCGPSNRADALQTVKAQFSEQGGSNINFQAVDVLVIPWLD